MADLNPSDLDALLRPPPSNIRPPLRDKVDNFQQSLSSGEGILPKILGGAVAIPAALTHLKTRDVPLRTVDQ